MNTLFGSASKYSFTKEESRSVGHKLRSLVLRFQTLPDECQGNLVLLFNQMSPSGFRGKRIHVASNGHTLAV